MTRLLVIDDEPNVLFSLEESLKTDELDVITARTAQEGIELVRRRRPDAVILDVRLPDLSGLEAFDRIRQIDPRLPVVVITAFAATETAIEAMKRGAFEYLLKPVDLRQLREVVAKAYDDYFNGIWRSTKCWRRGDELGARLEAAETVDALLRMLFALERQWRPFGSRVSLRLPLLAPQGWQLDELHASLRDLLMTADARRHVPTMRRVVVLMAERGYGHIYDGWKEQIDRALAWSF